METKYKTKDENKRIHVPILTRCTDYITDSNSDSTSLHTKFLVLLVNVCTSISVRNKHKLVWKILYLV